MQYFYHPASPNCRKVSAFIELHGIDVERRIVDLPKQQQRTQEFLAINPNGQVPALVDGATKLWESNAILIYLAEKTSSKLWPSDHRRLEILRWMFWEQSSFMYATGIVFFQRVIKPLIGAGEPDEARVKEGIAKFHRCAKVLDDQLTTSPFVVENELTLADLAVASQLGYAEQSQLPLAEYSHVSRWWRDLDDIPAWKDTAPSFG